MVLLVKKTIPDFDILVVVGADIAVAPSAAAAPPPPAAASPSGGGGGRRRRRRRPAGGGDAKVAMEAPC